MKVPLVDGDLSGEDSRAASIAFLEDFVEVTTGTGVVRFEAPIVENEEVDAGEAMVRRARFGVPADLLGTAGFDAGVRAPDKRGGGVGITRRPARAARLSSSGVMVAAALAVE
jgi:hypothetical protein